MVCGWAAAATTASSAAATLGTLVAELGDYSGEGKEAGVTVGHRFGESEVRLGEGFDRASCFRLQR